MKNGKFENGTLIKGKDLRGHILCKILSENLVMRGFQYKMGLNEDVNQLATEGSCQTGLHFCIIKNICNYVDYGTKLAVVSVPDEEDVYVDDFQFRAHRMEIKKVMPLGETATWEYLQENGANITTLDSYAVRYAAEEGYLEVVRYLHENAADITAQDSYAVILAAKNGHLDIVEYLYENGASIVSRDDFAIRWAASNGHLEVVKYLHGNGADVTARDNLAVRCAAENGHLEVVKYLREHGADITAHDNEALYWASKNYHMDVVKYLKANMQ